MSPAQEKHMRRRLAFAEFIKLYPFSTADLDGEEWRPIEGYERIYQVSNFGRVRSLKHKTPKILKPKLEGRGYLCVILFNDGVKKIFYVHRLVAKVFLANPQNKPQVNHFDGNKFNNHINNLEWATSKENNRHAFAVGLNRSGEEHGQAKLTAEQVIYIRENPESLTQKQLSKKFGVVQTTISNIQVGKNWRRTGGNLRQSHQRKFLTNEQRDEIRKLYATGNYSQLQLGKMFGTASTTIHYTIHKKD